MSPIAANPSPSFRQVAQACSRCVMIGQCLPAGLTAEELRRMDAIVGVNGQCQRGADLYRAGETIEALYAVRSGSFKSYRLSETGEEHVTGFFLPGDLLGLDGLHKGVHASFAVPLENSVVCRFPLDRLDDIMAETPRLTRKMTRVVSRDLDNQIERARNRSADAAVSAFLLDLRERMVTRGFDAGHLSLKMSRRDIGNHLRLRIETVSRAFSRLRDQGVITVDGRDLTFLDPDRLRTLARQD
ncbi:MAG: helix-turn-helix domain-containing protein [Pseudomonadota bacterium]|nr:helix-turn-helix domain-containing protein [Pseudomonadota bacterium]